MACWLVMSNLLAQSRGDVRLPTSCTDAKSLFPFPLRISTAAPHHCAPPALCATGSSKRAGLTPMPFAYRPYFVCPCPMGMATYPLRIPFVTKAPASIFPWAVVEGYCISRPEPRSSQHHRMNFHPGTPHKPGHRVREFLQPGLVCSPPVEESIRRVDEKRTGSLRSFLVLCIPGKN